MLPESADLSTRDSILYLLKTRGPSTIGSLSKELGITPMGVRQHLRQLEAQGYVQVTQKRGGVGRPSHIYSLTEAADERFTRSYYELAEFLIDALRTYAGNEIVDEVFRKRAQQFIKKHKDDFADRSLLEKLEMLTKLQDEAGYLASLNHEADKDRYILTEHNCTIAKIAQRYREACKYELESFQELLGDDATIERVECLTTGGVRCQYIVQPEVSS